MLNQLVIATFEENIQLQPGERHSFALALIRCCVFLSNVTVPTEWSVTPTEGVTLNPQSGVLTVDASTPEGSVFTVTADVEDGLRFLSIEVRIYDSATNPFVGVWREGSAQLDCDTGGELPLVVRRIQELEFRGDNTFSVTWTPFGTYRDYWGTYTYDLEQGTLDLTVDEGNYVPDDVDGSGTFSFDEQGLLTLSGIWLGISQHDELANTTDAVNCGHQFVP